MSKVLLTSLMPYNALTTNPLKFQRPGQKPVRLAQMFRNGQKSLQELSESLFSPASFLDAVYGRTYGMKTNPIKVAAFTTRNLLGAYQA